MPLAAAVDNRRLDTRPAQALATFRHFLEHIADAALGVPMSSNSEFAFGLGLAHAQGMQKNKLGANRARRNDSIPG